MKKKSSVPNLPRHPSPQLACTTIAESSLPSSPSTRTVRAASATSAVPVTETGLPTSLSTNGVLIAIAGSSTAVVTGPDERVVGTDGEDVNGSETRSAAPHPTDRQPSAMATAALMRSPLAGRRRSGESGGSTWRTPRCAMMGPTTRARSAPSSRRSTTERDARARNRHPPRDGRSSRRSRWSWGRTLKEPTCGHGSRSSSGPASRRSSR